MKKTLLSIAFAMFGMGAMAQNAVDGTFVFCDSKGNEIANGSVVNVTEVDADEFGGGEDKMHSGLFVKYNGTGNGGWAGMSFEIKRIDNGKLQHCFPGQCYVYTTTGTTVRKEAMAVKKNENQNINSEWMPVAKGLCTVAYTVHVADRDGNLTAQGPTVTVNYCNGVEAPDNVPGVQADKANGKMYNLNGQEVDKNFHGVVIQNGKKHIR